MAGVTSILSESEENQRRRSYRIIIPERCGSGVRVAGRRSAFPLRWSWNSNVNRSQSALPAHSPAAAFPPATVGPPRWAFNFCAVGARDSRLDWPFHDTDHHCRGNGHKRARDWCRLEDRRRPGAAVIALATRRAWQRAGLFHLSFQAPDTGVAGRIGLTKRLSGKKTARSHPEAP